LANFYEQCEKIKHNYDEETEIGLEYRIAENTNKHTILKSIDSNINSNNKSQAPSQPPTLLYNPNKRKAPIALNNNTSNNNATRVSSPIHDDQINNINGNKENNNDKNSTKVLTTVTSTPAIAPNDIVLICNSLKVKSIICIHNFSAMKFYEILQFE
jgi:hypothetical protein